MRGRWVRAAGIALTAAWAVLASGVASAADLQPRVDSASPPVASFRDRWEVRLGPALHGVGTVEKGPVDINAELIFPQFHFLDVNSRWNFLIPRLHVGGMIDFAGRTSYAYTGGLWTFPITDRFFVEGFVGGAVHNGSLAGDPANNKAALGCRLLFHVGGSVGYWLTPRWNVTATFDHVSNGNAALGACPRNQGLNAYAIRAGYSF